MTPATKRKRGRPEAPFADFGPRARLDNGTAVLAYRADPDRPNAPDIRAAKAFVKYEHVGLLPDQFAAARRIYDAVATQTGATEDNGGGLGGRAYWQVGGPTMAMMEAAKTLREVARVLGRAHERAVLLLLVDGNDAELDVARGGLATMAAYWQLD